MIFFPMKRNEKEIEKSKLNNENAESKLNLRKKDQIYLSIAKLKSSIFDRMNSSAKIILLLTDVRLPLRFTYPMRRDREKKKTAQFVH